MPVERRGWVIAFEIGSTGNGRNPIFNGRRQPSCGGTSRMTRECQVRICERLGVKFPWAYSAYAGIYCDAAKGPLLKTQRTCQQASPLQQRASNVVFCDIGWSYETLFLSGVRSARFT